MIHEPNDTEPFLCHLRVLTVDVRWHDLGACVSKVYSASEPNNVDGGMLVAVFEYGGVYSSSI